MTDSARDLFDRLVVHLDGLGRASLRQEEWERHPDTIDYQAEDTQRMLMEKARYVSSGPGLSGTKVRFWLKWDGRVVEKFFTASLDAVGYWMPVCTGFDAARTPYETQATYLSILVSAQRRIVVAGENALAAAQLPAAEADALQARLKALRYECLSRKFPPAIIRNFELVT